MGSTYFILLLLLGAPAAIAAGIWPAISHRRKGGTLVGTWFVTFAGQIVAGGILVFLVTFADTVLAGVWGAMMLYVLPLTVLISIWSAAPVVLFVRSKT
jgi:hypothetical protein